MEEEFGEMCITICIDKNGHIKTVEPRGGGEMKYHPDETKKLVGSKTRLLTPNDCCWRYTPLGWRCSPAYC